MLLYSQGSPFLIFLTALAYNSIIVELVKPGIFSYDAYLICGDTLYRNGYKLTTYDLQQLTEVKFMPFNDAFKLKFQNGQSVVIRRPGFQKESVSAFVNTAIDKSKLFVVVEEDAKTKLQAPAALLES